MENNNDDREKDLSADNQSQQPKRSKENDDFTHNDWDDNVDTDKYLALEQPGVTYTRESRATMSSDSTEGGEDSDSDTWQSTGDNSRNSDAFNQDDYILRDNIDLDEDQNTSISSEDNDK